jgi:hypothetical protein
MTGTTTTTKQIGVENGEGVPGKIEHIALAANVVEHTLTVRAVASRSCIRDVNNVFEVRESRHLRMGGADDPRAKVFGLLLSPITLPVSAVISGVSVLGDDTVTRATKVDHREKYACTTPAAQLPVAIELPSGARDTAVTDDRGELVYAIPLTEPYAGTIVVKNTDATREVAYRQTLPALVEAREAMEACSAGAATLALQLDVTGHVVHAWVARDTADTSECVRGRLARVAFPFHDETIELPFDGVRVVDTARRLEPVCATIDEKRDQLSEPDRVRARRVLARVLEEQNLFVTDGRCSQTFSAWHEQTGGAYTIHVRGKLGARHTTVPSAADIPSAYAQLVQLLAA